MAAVNRAPNEGELEKLIAIYLKAETDIINEIGRLRSQGLVGNVRRVGDNTVIHIFQKIYAGKAKGPFQAEGPASNPIRIREET